MKHRTYQEKRNRVIAIIVIQILVIATSFAIISQFTIDSEFLGNSINISGSNRFLGELLFHSLENKSDELEKRSAYNTISDIDKNIYLLKNGNIDSTNSERSFENFQMKDAKTKKISISLKGEFAELESTWNEYRNSALNTINYELVPDSDNDLIHAKVEFIKNADKLTLGLSAFSAIEASNLFKIQILLLFFNISTHVLLLYLVFKILTREQKIEKNNRTYIKKNEDLKERLQNLRINKNSIQITSTLFLEELKQAEKRTKKLANLSEEQKIDHFWNVFFSRMLKTRNPIMMS